jgi:hypothetical protein
MKPTTMFVWFLFLAFIVGMIIGAVKDEEPVCETRQCPCTGTGRAVDIDCNACSIWDPIVVTGIVNLGYYCGARQINMCFERELKEVRYEKNESSCVRRLQLFQTGHLGGVNRHKR